MTLARCFTMQLQWAFWISWSPTAGDGLGLAVATDPNQAMTSRLS